MDQNWQGELGDKGYKGDNGIKGDKGKRWQSFVIFWFAAKTTAFYSLFKETREIRDLKETKEQKVRFPYLHRLDTKRLHLKCLIVV